jgi:hypothetical protein
MKEQRRRRKKGKRRIRIKGEAGEEEAEVGDNLRYSK